MSRRAAQKREYDRRTYCTHLFRVRIDSALADRVAEYILTGNSLNFLITRLLCEHFCCELPHRWYREVTTERLYPPVRL